MTASAPALASTPTPSFQGIGDLPGGSYRSVAFPVSGDGSTVVGHSAGSNGEVEAFRWTSAGGIAGLGDIAGGGFQSVAQGVNADGSVIIGRGVGNLGPDVPWVWSLGARAYDADATAEAPRPRRTDQPPRSGNGMRPLRDIL